VIIKLVSTSNRRIWERAFMLGCGGFWLLLLNHRSSYLASGLYQIQSLVSSRGW
jgi:hypothetical protein